MNHLRTRNLPRLWAFLTILALLLATSLAAPATGAAGPAPVAPAAPQLLQFTAGGHVLGFAPDAAWLVTGSHALRVGFEGANAVTPASDGSADDSLPPEGELLAAPREATHGQGGAAPLGRVTYTNLWDGISLTYEATPDGAPGGVAKSTYTLAPGADPAQIRLHYNVPAEIQADGSLRLAFETGQMTESAPLAWQEIAGQRVPVEAVFTLTPGPSPYEGEGGSDEVGFRLGAYDPRYPLTIDPTYQWHTFYGGTGYDYGNAIALDGSGNIYVAGYSSASWQGDGNTSPLHAYTGGSYDIFVLKLNSAGAYQWHTFYGGSGNDYGYSIAVDGVGNVVVAGLSTASWLGDGNTSPLHAYTGYEDIAVLKLNSAGAYQWHTFYGGSYYDNGYSVAVDGSGNVVVAGYSSTSWLGDGNTSPLHAYTGGSYDIFVLKLNSAGAYQWHTFYGGSGSDYGRGIAVDGVGNVVVAGYSTAWLGDGNASPLHAYTGGNDIFVLKLNSAGAYQWHTFYGGSGNDYGYGIAVDGVGNVVVAGYSSATWQGDGNTSPLHAYTGNYDIFVLKLNSAGAYQWHTFYGGSGNDYGYSIAVDGVGNVVVAGYSTATWLGDGNTSPLHAYTGNYDIFVLKLNSAGAYQWHTFYGGSYYDYGYSIAVDGRGNLVVAGYSTANWLGDGNASPLHAYTGNYDIFVLKLYDPPPVTITKSVAPASALPGDTITYTLNLANNSALTVTNVTVTDTVPVSVTNTSVISSGVAITQQVSTRYVWDVADLAPGASAVITITGALSEPLTSGSFDNVAAFSGYAESIHLEGESTASLAVLNVPPVAADDTGTVDEDSTANAIDVLANDTDDLNGDSLTVDSVTDPAHGTAVDNDTDVLYTPDADFSGTDVFTYTVSDGHGGADTAVVTITVTNVNDLPQAFDDAFSVAQDSSDNALDVLANDSDAPDSGETLTVSAVDDPPHGAAVDGTDVITYTPDAGFSGTDVFTYTVADGNGGFDTATVTVWVLGAVDLQIAKGVEPAGAIPGATITYTLLFTNAGPGTAIASAITDTIPVSVTGTSVISSSDVALVPRGGATYAWDLGGNLLPGQGGVITITGALVVPLPAGSLDNTAVITAASPDTGAGNNTGSATLTVLNGPPVAAEDAYTVDEDSSDNAFDVLANDTDPANGDSLSVEAVADPANGTAADNDTNVLYTPDANFSGTDVFTYTVSDGNGGYDTAAVTVTVTGSSDPPVAVDDAYSTDEDTPLTVTAPGVLANDSDPDGDPLTALLMDASHVEGAIEFHGDGSFTYTPTLDYNGEITFTYYVTSHLQFIVTADFGASPFDNLLNYTSYDVDLGDVDGDGDLDAVFGTTGAEYVWLNQGGAQGGTPGDFSQFSIFGGYTTRDVDLGDLDGDGDLDAVTANDYYYGYNYAYLNNGSGTFSTYDTLGGYYYYTYDVDLGDVDGDGDLDAVLTTNSSRQVLLNDGTGNFGGVYDSFGSSTAYEVDLGDVDGDGDLDAIFGVYNGNKEVWLNDGTGNFGASAYDSFASSYRYVYDVDLGDVDGDGDLDAVFAHTSNQPQEVWLNQGGAQGGTSGDFGTAPADSFGSGTTYEVDLGDLDEDGDLDVILANYNGDKEVWLNQGGAQGGTPGDLGTSVHDSFSTSYRYAYDVELGDVNGDGALDAVVAHYNQYSEVWLNQKPVTWDTSNVATVTVTVNPIIIPPACFAEIDGDNTTDFASSDAGAVQAALDAVSTGGTVKLAGTCVGVQVTEWHTQTAYITRSVTVQGGHTTTDWLAAPDAVAHPTTLDADGNGRVFYITQDIAATVENLTVAGGSPSSGDEQGGAGFLIYSATVTINNTQIVTNTSTEHGGGILNRSGLVTIRNSRICNNQARGGGGIANRSTMTVENTILCDNVVSHPTELATGGAINNEGGTVALDGVRIEGNSAMIGGGILNQGSLVMTDTVVLSNTATMAGGGLVHTASTMALERSTVAYNSAPSGGGLYQTYMGPATFSARNSTFSQNSATAGGGGAIANAPYPGYSTAGGDVILDSVTLYNNPSTAAGSAIYNVTGTVTLSNTIVAETVGTAANCSHSGNGGIVSSGYNLDSGNSCGFAATGDVVNTNPNLAALADNGGPTPTHALHTGSPALDHGTCTVTTDQRGATRPMDGDADGTATCDIGAFELGWVQCGIQAALEPANYTFPGNVILNVTDDGSDLDCLRVTDIPHHHPQATSALETGKYWQFDGLQSDQSTAATTDYSLNVTLPWAGADNGDTVCRWTGATWDCAADSYVANTSVTRDNVTQLSDWAVEDNTPTAVTLASFTAAADGRAIRLAWETVSELDNLGFHLYRQAAAGERVRLNAALIPGQNPGSPAGAVYTWLDEGVTPGVAYTYWLEAVDAHGGAALHGPVQATLSPAPYRYYLPLVMGGF